jgi:hypothetical protein
MQFGVINAGIDIVLSFKNGDPNENTTTGRVIDLDRKTGDRSRWTQFSFPTRWHYDALWGLDYLRKAGVEPDQRVAEAIELVEKKRDVHGRWPLENPHAGEVHFDMEFGAGKPSRWNTLRALRVLDWYRTRETNANVSRSTELRRVNRYSS